MKRSIPLCLLLALLLALPALAETSTAGSGFDAPALDHPEARYDSIHTEDPDDSDRLIFMVLASQNDNDADIAAYGAIHCVSHLNRNANGEWDTVESILQSCDNGPILIQSATGKNLKAYITEERVFVRNGDRLEEREPLSDEDFAYMVSSFRFPFAYPESLAGMREDDNGYTYYLIRTDDETSVEYVTDANDTVVQARVYRRDEDGVLRLNTYADYRVGDPEELPADLLDLLAGEAEADAPREPGDDVEGSGGDADGAESVPMPDVSASVTGDFDVPAMSHPEERYEYFVEESDGSEYLIYVMLDVSNDEAEETKNGNALHVTENWSPNEDGSAGVSMDIYLQSSPYGPMMIAKGKMLWMDYNIYYCGANAFSELGGRVEAVEGHSQEDMDFYTASYHFPYGSLETLNGMRKDDNGYNYFFIASSDGMAFEYVVGEAMKILQLRVYLRDDDGVYNLDHFVDYEVVPAPEVPQAVLDAFDEVMEPVPETDEASGEAADAETDAERGGEAPDPDALMDNPINNAEEEPET